MMVLVDAGVFNMRLIRYTHNLNIPTYYIMPPRMSLQHRPEHSNTTFIYYYDFEKKQLMGLNAHQVKHPKASLIKQQAQREFPIKKLALFPGSRRSELKHHIPILESIRQSMNMDAIYYIQQPHNQKLAQKLGVPKSLIKNTPPQDITADFAICSSGTITLELALRHIPMVCIYKLGKLDYLLIKQCVNVKHIALPNIILDAKRVPELIQHDCNAKKITHHIQSLTKKDIDTQLKDFESIREKLLESPSLQSLLSEE
jgi:lipid-A-disaccharide synthase